MVHRQVFQKPLFPFCSLRHRQQAMSTWAQSARRRALPIRATVTAIGEAVPALEAFAGTGSCGAQVVLRTIAQARSRSVWPGVRIQAYVRRSILAESRTLRLPFVLQHSERSCRGDLLDFCEDLWGEFGACRVWCGGDETIPPGGHFDAGLAILRS